MASGSRSSPTDRADQRPASRVVLYTIPGRCPLCDEARREMAGAGIEFEEVDIRTDRALLRAYRLEIPVITVDGEKAFVGRVDLPRLRGLLRT